MKYGLVDLHHRSLIAQGTLAVRFQSAQNFCQELLVAAERLLASVPIKRSRVQGVGIGLPGFVDAGQVTCLPESLRYLEGVNVEQLLAERVPVPIAVENDARIIALGERDFGRHRPSHRMLSVTLGTGIGLALLADGQFSTAAAVDHMAGHIPIGSAKRPCICCFSGCLESALGASRLHEDLRRAGVVGAEEIARPEHAFNGPVSRSVITPYLDDLATALNCFVYLFAPDLIVLGGGLSRVISNHLADMASEIKAKPYPTYKVSVEVTKLWETAGVLGAASLAWAPVQHEVVT